jgi:hypothetical protein
MTIKTRSNTPDINANEYGVKAPVKHRSRVRSNFSCHESQVLFGKKLEIAMQLRARGARYTAQFLARHRTLPELEMMLKTF